MVENLQITQSERAYLEATHPRLMGRVTLDPTGDVFAVEGDAHTKQAIDYALINRSTPETNKKKPGVCDGPFPRLSPR